MRLTPYFAKARIRDLGSRRAEFGREAQHATRQGASRRALQTSLRVVTINVGGRGQRAGDLRDAERARTPLLALDLVKNVVFLEATRQGFDLLTICTRSYGGPQLDDEYWRVEVRQGRLFRPRAELFLMHWLGMKLRTGHPSH